MAQTCLKGGFDDTASHAYACGNIRLSRREAADENSPTTSSLGYRANSLRDPQSGDERTDNPKQLRCRPFHGLR